MKINLLLIPLLLLAAVPFSAAAPATASATAQRTKAEVDKIIDEAGKTPPDWWDKTPLNFPQTLDLSWNKTKGKWENQKTMDAWLWDNVYPNPAKWREGVKVIMHSLTVSKGNAAVAHKAASSLADMYTQMLQDYARGAYWAKKAGNMEMTLAECYYKLGCKDAAKQILNDLGRDDTFNALAVKLWADMGELKTALAWAKDIAEEGRAGAAWLAAGDACRKAGETADAIMYYKKVLGVSQPNEKRNRERAQANLDVIKMFDNLDLGKIADGTYKADSRGYVDLVEVTVTIKSHKIDQLEVTRHREKQFYASLTEVPQQILAKQAVKGIDATTGATITSEAIINATAKALAKQNP